MKRSIFFRKSVCLLIILSLITLSITAQKKGTIAYSKKINGNDVVICPVKKVTDTLFLKLSSLVESCGFVKLQNSPEAFFDRGWHTEISGLLAQPGKYWSIIYPGSISKIFLWFLPNANLKHTFQPIQSLPYYLCRLRMIPRSVFSRVSVEN